MGNNNISLSIITPCSRFYNLPIIYKSILDLNDSSVEWIVIFDGEIDYKILEYERDVKIILLNKTSFENDSRASQLRNLGLKNCNGDYIYYLDDDNIIHPELIKNINYYQENDCVLVFNQLSEYLKPRFSIMNDDNTNIDTAQIVVPKKHAKIKWGESLKCIDELPYLNRLKEITNVKYILKPLSFRNYLRKLQ